MELNLNDLRQVQMGLGPSSNNYSGSLVHQSSSHAAGGFFVPIQGASKRYMIYRLVLFDDDVESLFLLTLLVLLFYFNYSAIWC